MNFQVEAERALSYIERGNKGFGQALAALFAGGFVTFATLYSTQPLMPEFSQQFHVSPAVASLSLSFSTAALAIAMLVVAALSETHGRKPLMVISLFLSAGLEVVLAFSPSFPLLLVIRALQGIVLAGLPSIAMAYVSEEFHPNSAGMVMGMYISGTSVGGMAGRIVVGTLTDAFSWRVAIGIVGAISVLVSLLFWLTLPASRHFKPAPQPAGAVFQSLFEKLRDAGLFPLYVLAFLLMGSFVTMYNYVSYLLAGPPYRLSQTIVGWIFIVYLTGTFSSTWMGRMADRLGRGRVLLAGILIMLAGAVITLVPELCIKIFGIAVFTFGFFGAHSVASGWVGQRAVTHRAQASSLYLLFYYTGSSLAGAVGGLFWSRFAWPGVVLLIGVLLCVALFVAYLQEKRDTFTLK